MKFLAVLQLVCILFLSSFSGMKDAMAIPVEKTCCHKMKKMPACNTQTGQKDNCAKGCTMMLSCGICGFLVIEPLTIKATLYSSLEQQVALYKIGNLSGYFSSDWKPPKV